MRIGQCTKPARPSSRSTLRLASSPTTANHNLRVSRLSFFVPMSKPTAAPLPAKVSAAQVDLDEYDEEQCVSCCLPHRPACVGK